MRGVTSFLNPGEQSLRNPDRVIARVIDIGDFNSGQLLRQPVGDGLRAECCKRAEAGWFSPRSWTI